MLEKCLFCKTKHFLSFQSCFIRKSKQVHNKHFWEWTQLSGLLLNSTTLSEIRESWEIIVRLIFPTWKGASPLAHLTLVENLHLQRVRSSKEESLTKTNFGTKRWQPIQLSLVIFSLTFSVKSLELSQIRMGDHEKRLVLFRTLWLVNTARLNVQLASVQSPSWLHSKVSQE